jgi:glutaminyl-tRNA synthetase
MNFNDLKFTTVVVVQPLNTCTADDKFQFERHEYVVADRTDDSMGKPVFNLAVGLKDRWET